MINFFQYCIALFFLNRLTGNTIGLQLNNLPKSINNISVSNKAAQTEATKKIKQIEGTAVASIELMQTNTAVIYQVSIVGESINVKEEIIKR